MDFNSKADAHAWMCMDFFKFESELKDEDKDIDALFERLKLAKYGSCPYRSRCIRYTKTIVNRRVEPIQLMLF